MVLILLRYKYNTNIYKGITFFGMFCLQRNMDKYQLPSCGVSCHCLYAELEITPIFFMN